MFGFFSVFPFTNFRFTREGGGLSTIHFLGKTHSGQTTKGGGGKTPLTTKKKNNSFHDLKKNYQNLMKH